MLLHWYPVLGFLSIHATTEIFQKIFHGIPGYSYGFLIWCQPLPMTFIWSCCICSFPSNSHAIPMLLHYNCITSLCNICFVFNIICIVPIGCSWFTHIIPIVPPQEFLWLIQSFATPAAHLSFYFPMSICSFTMVSYILLASLFSFVLDCFRLLLSTEQFFKLGVLCFVTRMVGMYICSWG